MDCIDPFLTYFDENPDFNVCDQEKETEQLIRRNHSVLEFMEGKISADDLLGCIDESGGAADSYVEQVVTSIYSCMGRCYIENECGLLLPRRG